jgi:hypothetical protein
LVYYLVEGVELTPTENGVPQGTNTSTGANPGKLKTHLQTESGIPITDELEVVELVGLTIDEIKDETELEFATDEIGVELVDEETRLSD